MRRTLIVLVAALIVPAMVTTVRAQQQAFRVGGDIKPPTRTKYVAPLYPQMARTAGVSGIVILEATIGPDGHVTELKVVRSQPLLDQAAIEAVRQWEYTPTLINNTPVSVVMTVTVNFTQALSFEASLDRAKQLFAAGRFDDADRELDQARTLLRSSQSPLSPQAPPPPPPPPPPGAVQYGVTNPSAAPVDAPVRVGGDIKEPRKIRDAKPVYPPEAMAAGVQGVVIIEATIGPDGSVTNAKILRSQPMLDQAAVDSVRQWGFTPTYLNGVPVSVIMTVTVNFTLQ
jgi:TonB family protein